jgi:mRNA interferase HigB
MRIHLLTKHTVKNYIEKNKQSKVPLESWLNIVKTADWDIPQDIVSSFNSADLLGRGSNKVVFNIGGNKYRVICDYYFGKRKVRLFVNWIGTHSEYSKLCKTGKQYTIDQY